MSRSRGPEDSLETSHGRSSSLRCKTVTYEMVVFGCEADLGLTKVISVAVDTLQTPMEWLASDVRQVYDLARSYVGKVETCPK